MISVPVEEQPSRKNTYFAQRAYESLKPEKRDSFQKLVQEYTQAHLWKPYTGPKNDIELKARASCFLITGKKDRLVLDFRTLNSKWKLISNSEQKVSSIILATRLHGPSCLLALDLKS